MRWELSGIEPASHPGYMLFMTHAHICLLIKYAQVANQPISLQEEGCSKIRLMFAIHVRVTRDAADPVYSRSRRTAWAYISLGR